jgi:hypothetical protein
LNILFEKAGTTHQLDNISPVGAWLVDSLNAGEWWYYVLININTRYLAVIPADAVR